MLRVLFQESFVMDPKDEHLKKACDKKMMSQQRNQRHYLEKNFFNGIPLDEVIRTSLSFLKKLGHHYALSASAMNYGAN